MLMRSIVAGLAAAFLLAAQPAPPSGPLSADQQPDTQALARTVQALRRNAKVSADAGAQADKLIGEATALDASGQTGEARRRWAHAQALVTGKNWDAKDEFAWSLAVRPARIVSDQGMPLMADLSQFYSVPYKAMGALKLRASLVPLEAGAKAVKEFGPFDVYARDFIVQPFKFQADAAGVADGYYRLVAELRDGETTIASARELVCLAQGIETKLPMVEQKLAKIQGHDSAKASVRWPYDMARVVNLGIRKLGTTDFGLTETGYNMFYFSKELQESDQLLKALEAGKDPLYRAKGDHERHYWFAEAGEIMPYRMYVPSSWDGKKQLPMIFVMHGTTRDHNFYFDRDNQILPKLAEKNGYIVVSTMGYRPNGGYNANALQRMAPPPSDSGAAGARGGRGGRGGFAPNPGRQREAELSEKEALASLDLVIKEYNPDPSRIYLFGHSAGGTGGWYFASRYANRWAGVALSAFGTRADTYPFDTVKGLPIMVIVGTKDSPNTVTTVETMAKALKDKGFETEFLEVKDATHDTIVGLAEPTVFEFFNTHHRK